MAMSPSGAIVEFRHGLIERRHIKQGIVSETAVSLGMRKDASFDRALGSHHSGAILRNGQCAVIASCPLTFSDSAQLL